LGQFFFTFLLNNKVYLYFEHQYAFADINHLPKVQIVVDRERQQEKEIAKKQSQK